MFIIHRRFVNIDSKEELLEIVNSAAGTLVNTKDPYSVGAFRYSASPKAVGPRFGKTVNPRRARFGKRNPATILTRRRRR